MLDFDLRTADPADPRFRMTHSPFYWIAKVGGRYALDMDVVLKRIGMDIARWRILMTLTELQPASVSQLADHAVARLSTIAKTVQRLEQAGYVRTATRSTDGRVTEVFLTAAGDDVVARIRGQASRVFLQAFDGVEPAKVGELITVLETVFRRLEPTPE